MLPKFIMTTKVKKHDKNQETKKSFKRRLHFINR